MVQRKRNSRGLKIAQLRALIEVDRCGGFSKAAASLGLTTPSVWQQIRTLETEFGAGLVEVNGHQVRLNDNGRMLLMLAQPVLDGFSSLRNQFDELRQSAGKRLTIAAPTEILENELPTVIRAYKQKFPDVAISIIDRPSARAQEMLEAGHADLAIVGHLSLEVPPILEMQKLMDFPFMLLCPAQHPLLTGTEEITPEEIVRYPIVLAGPGTNTRSRTDEVFARTGLIDSLEVAMETSAKDLIYTYVRMGMGAAIAPISPGTLRNLQERLDAGNLVVQDVSDVFGTEHLVLLHRKHRHEPDHQAEFRSLLTAHLGGTD